MSAGVEVNNNIDSDGVFVQSSTTSDKCAVPSTASVDHVIVDTSGTSDGQGQTQNGIPEAGSPQGRTSLSDIKEEGDFSATTPVTRQSTDHTTTTVTRRTKQIVLRRSESLPAGDAPPTRLTKPAGGSDSQDQSAKELFEIFKNLSAKSNTTTDTSTTKTSSQSSGGSVPLTRGDRKSWGTSGLIGGPGSRGAIASLAGPTPKRTITRSVSDVTGSRVQRSPSAIKQHLLEWCREMTKEYEPRVSITNFSGAFSDGLAFCALIHHFYPDAFDFEALTAEDRRHNFTLAFDTAEQRAGIAPLLDVEDMMMMAKPDWRCVFCYVQSFHRRFALTVNVRVKKRTTTKSEETDD